MIKILQSNWMCALLGAITYLGTTLALWHTPKIQPPAAVVAAAVKSEMTGASWEFQNPEVDELIADLQHQKNVLDDREHQLNELAARLKVEQNEITVVSQNVTQMQAEFDRNVVRVGEEETANLKRLAKIYAAMTPEGVASVFHEMKDDEVVKVFAFMKDSETAPILEVMAHLGPTDAKRVAQLSERLKVTMYRTPPTKPS
jgi:flagellar motility protein MotE (MotC chaperone)